MRNPLRVLIVDDRPEVCRAIARALEHTVPHVHVRTLMEPAAAPDVADEFDPHAVSMDLDMPLASGGGVDAFGAIAAIAVRRPGCGVVVVSGHAGTPLVTRAVEAGAIGYMTKDEPPAAIAAAILAAADGKGTFSEGLFDGESEA